MSIVFLHAVADPHAELTKEKLLACAALSTRHQLADCADEADLILVMASPDGDPALLKVRSDALYRRLREKSVVYCEHDNAMTLLPGIYVAAAERWMSPAWTVSGPYFGKRRPSELPKDGVEEPIEHLYSFVGSIYTHPIRASLLGIKDDRALLRDTGDRATARYLTSEASEKDRLERWRSYDQALASSAFVLCPRGVCPGAIRFFETLRAGRAPVVISDEWVLPHGPDWDAFVVRVGEAEITRLPEILRELESEATERGKLARRVWESWFAEEVIFDRFVEWAGMIQQHRQDGPIARLGRLRMLFSREHQRTTLRSLVRRGRI